MTADDSRPAGVPSAAQLAEWERTVDPDFPGISAMWIRCYPHQAVRRYLPGDPCAHLLPGTEVDPVGFYPAPCGLDPDPASDWHGSGSQEEEDTAAAMPLCPVCAAILP